MRRPTVHECVTAINVALTIRSMYVVGKYALKMRSLIPQLESIAKHADRLVKLQTAAEGVADDLMAHLGVTAKPKKAGGGGFRTEPQDPPPGMPEHIWKRRRSAIVGFDPAKPGAEGTTVHGPEGSE